MVNGLIAVVSLLVAVFCFYKVQENAGTMYLVGGIIFALLTVVFGAMFMSGRVNKSEDIHITEQICSPAIKQSFTGRILSRENTGV